MVNLESHIGVQAFYDMMIYKHAPNLSCITEEFLTKKRFKKLEKVEFLRNMMASI